MTYLYLCSLADSFFKMVLKDGGFADIINVKFLNTELSGIDSKRV